MPRLPRLDAPGVVHHVIARGIEKGKIFHNDQDRNNFIQRLSELASSGAWIIYAWSLLPNHFHLLVKTGRTPLSLCMRSLMSGYAGYFNRHHQRVGHLFQNRFKSIVCEEETYLLELVRYIHLNPLRIKIVRDGNELDLYPYAGHSALLGRVERPWQDTKEILSRFGRHVSIARQRYGEFVAAGLEQGRRPELIGGGLLRSHGGWEQVQALRRGRENFRSDERILGSSDFVETVLNEADVLPGVTGPHPALDTIRERICRDLDLNQEALDSGGRTEKISKARGLISFVWVRHLGRSGRSLARVLGVSPQAILAAVKKVEKAGWVTSEDLGRWCGE